MAKIIEVKPLRDFSIYVRYSNGMDGTVSMKRLIKREEYKSISEIEEFEKVYVSSESGDIVWESGVSICRRATYEMLKLKKEMGSLARLLEPE